jgi:hypothetical protein
MFKVGDRVVRSPNRYMGWWRKRSDAVCRATDAEHTVEAVDAAGWVTVMGMGWSPQFMELVSAATPTARSNDPATSKGKRKVNKYEQAVLSELETDKLLARSPDALGLTGKEIALRSGHPLNCVTPRFAPLRRKGLIKDSGTKRDKQTVWVLA